MALNSFWYTEPAGGTKFRSYDSAGIHAQVVILGGTDTLALPTDSTYGLSIDIKRIASGAAVNNYITDPTTTTIQAAVLASEPDYSQSGLVVRTVGTVSIDTSDLLDIKTLLARMVWLFEAAYDLDSSEVTFESVGL